MTNTGDFAHHRRAPRTVRLFAALLTLSTLAACASNSAIQPDRTVFSLDNNYQRYGYAMPIEQTFDSTVAVFREAGYKLDVIDRATGQISGQRGARGDKGSGSDKDLKFYALVLPKDDARSELSLKIVQVINSGGIAMVGGQRAELIVTDPAMYQYTFRRIGSGGGTAAAVGAVGQTAGQVH